MQLSLEVETYDPAVCAVFRTLDGPFGALSNFSSDFPTEVAGCIAETTEALYQACRYPQLPDLQRKILDQKTPMEAKRVAKNYWRQSRQDWLDVRIEVMRWCLELKLAQHMKPFGDHLVSTGDLTIVELSFRDDFWGATPTEDGMLRGQNMLGKLLLALREDLRAGQVFPSGIVKPPSISDFRFAGVEVGAIGVCS